MKPPSYLDCEISLADRDRARLSIGRKLYSGRPALDETLERRLLERELEPKDYGRLLFEALFPDDPDDDLLLGYRESLTIARHNDRRLRLRLHIASTAPPELHELHWELLYDPRQHLALGRSPEVAFSRYLDGSFEPGTTIVGRTRLLVVLSDPVDVTDYGLPKIDQNLLDRTLAGALSPLTESVDYVFLDGPVTVERIRDRLVAGRFHALHFQAHGRLDPESSASALLLEDEERQTHFVDVDLLSEILEGQRNLRLVTLIACHSGASRPSSTFTGLGPALVRRGISAVVAMRHEISLAAAARFTEHFYLNLLRGGRIDIAANEARLQLHFMDPESTEWATPALYMHLRDGLLWQFGSASEVPAREDGPQLYSPLETRPLDPEPPRKTPATLHPAAPQQKSWHRFVAIAAVALFVLAFAIFLKTRPRADLPDLSELRSHGQPSFIFKSFETSGETPSAPLTTLALSELLQAELKNIGRLLPTRRRFEVLHEGEVRKTDETQILVHGEYTSDGQTFRLAVYVEPVQTDNASQLTTSGKYPEDLFDSVTKLATSLVEILGFDLTDAVSSDRLHSVYPRGAEATRLLRLGSEQMRLLNSPEARRLFEAALQVEPQSPLLRSALADALSDLGDKRAAMIEVDQALETLKLAQLETRCLFLAQGLELRARWKHAAAVLTLCNATDQQEGIVLEDRSNDRGLRLAFLQAKARWPDGARSTLDDLDGLTVEDLRYLMIDTEIHRSLARFEEQRAAARLAASRARARSAPLIEARALILEGEALLRLGDPQAATAALETARALYHGAGHQRGEADAHQLIGNSFFDRGQMTEAGNHYGDARRLYAAIGNRLMEARVLGNKALILKQQGDDQAAILLYEDCLRLHRSSGDHGGEAYTLIHLADIYEKNGAISKAEKNLAAALDLERKSGSTHRPAYPLRVLGAFQSRHGNLSQSMKLLEEALELYRGADNKQGESAAARQLAKVRHQRGDLSTAHRLLETALEFYRQGGNEDAVASTSRDLGDVLTAKAELDKATGLYRRALEFQDQQVDRTEAARTRLSLARLQLFQEQPANAVRTASTALEDLKSTTAPLEQALAQSVLASALLKCDRPKEAESKIEAALRLLGSVRSPAYFLPVEIVASEVQAETSDVQAANWRLQAIIASSTSADFFELKMEAQLLQGKLALKTGNQRAGTARLEDLRRKAEAHGFLLLSRRATEILDDVAQRPSRSTG